MPNLTLYHLEPQSSFHFGTRGIEQEQTGVSLPSDSLFAAIMSAWLESGGSPDELADAFPQEGSAQSQPPFLLTSVFPRAGKVRFYPVLTLRWLLSPVKLDELHQKHRLKEVKKIQYISEGLFKKAIAGESLDELLPPEHNPQLTDQGLYLQKGALWLSQEEVADLPALMKEKAISRKGNLVKALGEANVWQTGKSPRVTIDRVTNASQIFHTGRLLLSPGCGFWFGVAWLNPNRPMPLSGGNVQEAVNRALNVLTDNGLGAERSVGYGQFNYQAQVQPISLPNPQPGGMFVTLSRYHPQPVELPVALAHPLTAYQLVSVAGWLNSPVEKAQRRRRVWLTAEGSIIHAAESMSVWGNLVDTRPSYNGTQLSHPVWRYGLACPVGLTIPPHLSGEAQ